MSCSGQFNASAPILASLPTSGRRLLDSSSVQLQQMSDQVNEISTVQEDIQAQISKLQVWMMLMDA